MANKKETIEYGKEFIQEWNQFCLEKGLSKRQASHGALLTFMNSNPDEREKAMAKAKVHVNAGRSRLGSRNGQKAEVPSGSVVKETIEYDADFLERWSDFCNAKGFVKRHAAVSARIVFMKLSAEDRENCMTESQLGRARSVKKLETA